MWAAGCWQVRISEVKWIWRVLYTACVIEGGITDRLRINPQRVHTKGAWAALDGRRQGREHKARRNSKWRQAVGALRVRCWQPGRMGR